MTEYKENKKHIQKTIELSKQAFYKGLESRQSTWSQFLTGQIRFIRKRWWVLQFLILTLLWSVMYLGNSKSVLRREAAALIPLFGMMLMPELWRNVYYHSTEVEKYILLYNETDLCSQIDDLFTCGSVIIDDIFPDFYGHCPLDFTGHDYSFYDSLKCNSLYLPWNFMLEANTF